MRKWFLCLLLVATASTPICGQKKLSAQDAKNHIGENATVCGTVASEHFAGNTKGQPTFINLDEPYPRQIFTVLIWGSDRSAFGKIPTKLCVTHNGQPDSADGFQFFLDRRAPRQVLFSSSWRVVPLDFG